MSKQFQVDKYLNQAENTSKWWSRDSHLVLGRLELGMGPSTCLTNDSVAPRPGQSPFHYITPPLSKDSD